MDNNKEQKSLFEMKKENKVLSEKEQITDKKTGQIKFISQEVEVRALIKEEMEPILENNRIISEKSNRIANSLEKAIPHIQNKMIGNEKEAYQVWCDNSENADIARVNTSAPAELVYELISADLAKAFGCKSCYVSYLLKDLNLWTDEKYVNMRKVNASQDTRFYRRAILDEVYVRLENLIKSEKYLSFTEKRQATYKEIYDTMKFYRG